MLQPFVRRDEDQAALSPSRRNMAHLLIDHVTKRYGRVEIRLAGKKLRGGYTLVRMSDAKWLLIKMDDEEAALRRDPVRAEPTSVLSGRTLEEIRTGASS